jgi:tetratricopeptide (TPR) repeat protein
LTNNNQGAIEDWKKSIALKPNSSSYNNLGLYKAISGDYHEGLINIDKSIELKYKSADAHVIRGFIRENSGDRQRAILDYQQALKLNPKIIDEWKRDAKQLDKSHNLIAAQKYYQMIRGLEGV